MFGILEVWLETEFAANLLADAGNGFDLAQLIDRLGVICDRAEAIHSNRNRAHT